MAPLRYRRSLALILVSYVLGLSSGIQPITKPAVRLTLDSNHAQPLQAAPTSTNSADERLVDLASLLSTSDSESYHQQSDPLEFPESGTGAVTQVFKDQPLSRQSSSADDPDEVLTEASVCLLKGRSSLACSSCDLVRNAIAKIADLRLTAEDCCASDDLYAACLRQVAAAQAGKSDINVTDTSDVVGGEQDSRDSNGMTGERDVIGEGEKYDVKSTVDASDAISATGQHQVAGRSSKHDVTSEVDSAGNIDQPARETRTKKKSGNPFLGKRSINEEQDEEEAEVMKSGEIAVQSSEKRKQNPFLGKRIESNEFDEEEKRRGGNPFLGKRGGNPFLGKRGGNPFLGKREEDSFEEKRGGGNPFLGKRRGGDQFLGKKHGISYGGNPMIIKMAARRGKNPFLGKREESTSEKRANPFLGKRANPFLGKRANPFLGKRGPNPFLGKRANPFLGKRKNPFLGKREE